MEANMQRRGVRTVRRGLAAVLLVSGLLGSIAGAAEPAGNVFCSGVRVGDEIVLVNTRMLCNSCDPESIRSGLVVESYAVCDDVGHRRWQPSDLESFLAFDPSVRT